MRTTLDLDDQLILAAKQRAAATKTSLRCVIEDALREHLSPPPRSHRFELVPVIKKGKLPPRLDVADRAALYERMRGRS